MERIISANTSLKVQRLIIVVYVTIEVYGTLYTKYGSSPMALVILHRFGAMVSGDLSVPIQSRHVVNNIIALQNQTLYLMLKATTQRNEMK